MRQDPSSRPDLMGEMRFRVPLPIAIPLIAIVFIAFCVWGFSRLLLSLEAEAATTIALITAANVLIGCSFAALRPRTHPAGWAEIALIALYPIVIGVVLAQTGLGSSEAAEEHEVETGAPAGGEAPAAPAGDTDTVVAENVSFTTDALTVEANKPAELTLDNQDTALHNLVVTDGSAPGEGKTLFTSPDAPGGEQVEFTIDPLKPGEYLYFCEYHPSMTGTLTVE